MLMLNAVCIMCYVKLIIIREKDRAIINKFVVLCTLMFQISPSPANLLSPPQPCFLSLITPGLP